MIGLMVLGALLIYALVLIGASTWAFRAAKKSGKSAGKAGMWAAVAALVILAPVFWDAIPTYVAFKYYSQKEAGLKVFKTLEQWKQENPGVAETLSKMPDQGYPTVVLNDGKERSKINDRLVVDTRYGEHLFLSVKRGTRQLVDVKTNEVLAQYTGISAAPNWSLHAGGNDPNWFKLWFYGLNSPSNDKDWWDLYQLARNIGSK
jgi:hypothetical protein